MQSGRTGVFIGWDHLLKGGRGKKYVGGVKNKRNLPTKNIFNFISSAGRKKTLKNMWEG